MRIPVVVTAGAVAALLAGCQAAGTGQISGAGPASSSTTDSSVPPTPPPGPESVLPANGPGRCHTAQLAAAFGTVDAGAGQRATLLSLTNRSATPCRVYGYPGLLQRDAAAHPIATDVVRDANTRPALFTLTPGRAGWARLTWTAMPSADEPQRGDCEPSTASLLVTPPDETDPLTATAGLGPVCGHGRITVTAMSATKPPV